MTPRPPPLSNRCQPVGEFCRSAHVGQATGVVALDGRQRRHHGHPEGPRMAGGLRCGRRPSVHRLEGYPPYTQDRAAFRSPAWKSAIKCAAATAERLGLELAIATSAVWSATGGPWVRPAAGMKKLVWSVAQVTAGQSGTVTGTNHREWIPNTGTCP
ncbi:hypothetical protein E2R57_03890 [Arthrobacter nitrophenolicus]|uniref:Uncharacterized protein n=1 Tax=Arthrobacter nitrophenolicus TaxID=683150 RepID=A0A4R5Y565_9MICC|nr:hypothetical protein E2R57_03890 [Arthrobacter nitrophenolicus]